MTIEEVMKQYPNLHKINEVKVYFSTLEEFENENTYVQVIDGEIMVLKHNGKYIINKL